MFVPALARALLGCQSYDMWIRASRVKTGLAFGLALACADTPGVTAPGVGTPTPSPDVPNSTPAPTDNTQIGGQTGSGGLPPGFSCQQVATVGCGPSLLMGFGQTETPLQPAASRCVPASELDPTLDAVPVCQCSFTRNNYFSDTGGTSNVAYTVGLAQRRSALGQGGDSCELRLGDECVFDSTAFAGCSLDAAETSCDVTCGQLSRQYSAAVAQSKASVEVLAAECVECPGGYCFGILRAGGRCFAASQYSLGFGYIARPIPCDATPAQTLQAQLDEFVAGSSCTIERPDPLTCEGDAGAACTLDAGGPLAAPADASTADAASSDASTLDAASTDAATTDAASSP
jgi:hypothetical protein